MILETGVQFQIEWRNLEKGVAPFPRLSVVAIEKGAFGSASTTVANLLTIYMSVCVCNRT